MVSQIYPESGAEFNRQEHARMLKAAQEFRLAAAAASIAPAPRRVRRSLRGMAYAAILIVVASLAFAAAAFAAAGGGSGGGGAALLY
jgi:hypothetical protein